jgi:hypothetical protein
MKMAVLKPIMWNDKGYRQPAGFPSTSGYSHDHGYGHEEWNNNPHWLWRGFKVFHTEGTGRISEAAKNGELGMVMIASHAGTAYALGIATNIYANTDDEMKMIADAVGVFKQWPAVWRLDTVRACFPSQAAFLRHWRAQYRWIRWKCPPDQYYWFPQPISLDPQRVTGKKRLAMHHGRFTLTTPAVLLDIVDAHLPKNRTAIRDWLSFGDFTQPGESQTTSEISGSKTRRRIQRSRNAPTDRRFQYWVEGDRTVEPLHHRLQARFVQHLKTRGINPQENAAFIDVKYMEAGTTVFCEIKPTDNVATGYAIRAAIGQLLEYRYKHNVAAALEIVVGKKPRAGEIAFLKSIGFRLAYFNAAKRTFVKV